MTSIMLPRGAEDILRRGPRSGSRSGGGSSSTTGIKRMPGGGPRFSPRFGGQERGSQGGDATAGVRRRGPVTDPNTLPRFITPENTLRGQRLGFDVREVNPDISGIEDAISRLQASSRGGGGGFDPNSDFLSFLRGQVRGDLEGGLNREDLIRRQFESQMPFLNEQFRDQADQVANRTAALGRTGSGMVDREFAELENQQELKRHGLLGQITAQAAQQAIQDRLGLMGQGQGIAGVQAQRDIGAANAANQARQTNIQGMSNALQGALGAANIGMEAQAQNRNTDLQRGRFLERQRAFEDQLAQQAQQTKLQRQQMLQQGFQSDPTAALFGAGNMAMQGAGEFGANAAAANAGLGGLARNALMSGAFGGGGGGGSLIDLFSGPSGMGVGGATPTMNPNVPSPGGPVNQGGLPSPELAAQQANLVPRNMLRR